MEMTNGCKTITMFKLENTIKIKLKYTSQKIRNKATKITETYTFLTHNRTITKQLSKILQKCKPQHHMQNRHHYL